MTITYTIPGATLLDQLDPATLDGLPNNDANDNCVGTSIADGLHIETGKTYDGDEVKDAVYGAGYVGTESAAHYVNYCATQGVSLTAHNDTQAGLVAFIRAEVAVGHPVILTMPGDWNTPEPDPVHPSTSTHVGIAVGYGPDEIRVMNPWHGFYQDATDEWWQARLCYGQVWLMQQTGANTVSGVPSGWTDDGATLTAPNGVPVVHGIRAYVLAENHDPSDVPVAPEQAVGLVEYGHTALGPGVVQFFLKSGQRSWTPTAGTFATYNGQEEHALRQALSDAQAATTAAQANVTAAQGQRDALSAQLQQAQAQAASDASQIASLQQQLAAAQGTPHDNPAADAALAALQAFKAALAAS